MLTGAARWSRYKANIPSTDHSIPYFSGRCISRATTIFIFTPPISYNPFSLEAPRPPIVSKQISLSPLSYIIPHTHGPSILGNFLSRGPQPPFLLSFIHFILTCDFSFKMLHNLQVKDPGGPLLF